MITPTQRTMHGRRVFAFYSCMRGSKAKVSFSIKLAVHRPAAGLTPRMKLRLFGTLKRLNIEHRTSNIERPILMTLRFIYFKTSEPHIFEG